MKFIIGFTVSLACVIAILGLVSWGENLEAQEPEITVHTEFIMTEELFFRHLQEMVAYPYQYETFINQKGWILIRDPEPLRGMYVVRTREDSDELEVRLLGRRVEDGTVDMSPIGAVYYHVTGIDYEPWEPGNPNVDWLVGEKMGFSDEWITEMVAASADPEYSGGLRALLLGTLGLEEGS